MSLNSDSDFLHAAGGGGEPCSNSNNNDSTHKIGQEQDAVQSRSGAPTASTSDGQDAAPTTLERYHRSSALYPPSESSLVSIFPDSRNIRSTADNTLSGG